METERVRNGWGGDGKGRSIELRVSDDTTMGSQTVAGAGGEGERYKVKPRGFWVDKSVVDRRGSGRETGLRKRS